jgi:LacI family transcriptional regulator
MACSDSRAQRVLEACGRAGVMIPDQVAVIGSGNDETICEFCDPPLSSVVPGYRQVGYEAARMLDRLMRGAVAPSAPLYLKPLGVVTRQSTDVIAVEDPDTAAAVRFIREHACDGVRVQDVAEHCLLSRTELKRRFRRFLGRSVLDQIVRDRLNRAAQLLADTELPIAQIARLSGFSNQQRMGVVFRAKLGITPAQYRKQF